MSLKNNRAVRSNRNFMFGMLLMALVVFGCVGYMLYISFQNQKDKEKAPTIHYVINLSELVYGDSLRIAVNDSTIFDGIVPDSPTHCQAVGDAESNMISIEDLRNGETANANLPAKQSSLSVLREDGKITIMAMDMEPME